MRDAELLTGGAVNIVTRVGDVVHRAPGGSAFSRSVLQLLESFGWTCAPRLLTADAEREVLSFIEGVVPWDAPWDPQLLEGETLASVGRLLRELHDLTEGCPIATESVVCHNDLAPKNTVYRRTGARLEAVAFIDWDLAAPGPRSADVAFAAWQYAGLGFDSNLTTDEAARRMCALCDGYGLDDRTGLISAVLERQHACSDGIERAARDGNAPMAALVEQGVPGHVRASIDWVYERSAQLQRLLNPSSGPPRGTRTTAGQRSRV